jgi:hypothetical protein
VQNYFRGGYDEEKSRGFPRDFHGLFTREKEVVKE